MGDAKGPAGTASGLLSRVFEKSSMEIGLVGTGNIAGVIAEKASDYRVVCAYDAREETGREFCRKHKCGFLKPDEFPKLDLVVEAASQEAVGQYAEAFLGKGQSLMVMSVGALVDQGLFNRLRKAAEMSGARLILPPGAIAGLDGLRSAGVGRIDEVMLTTTKPPAGLGVDVNARTVLFDGPAKEAVKKFPKNVNVAATLSLAGIGFDKTKVRVVADPAVKNNRHEVHVKGEFGEMRAQVDNVPSPQNPKTSYLAAMSAIAAIKRFKESVVIG